MEAERYNRVTLMLIRRAGLLALSAVVLVCAGGVWKASHGKKLLPARIAVRPDRIRANGYDTAVLTIESRDRTPPSISISDNIHGAVVEEIVKNGRNWRAKVKAGVLPGRIRLRIESPGYESSTADITAIPDLGDWAQDGTPDFLRLDDDHDQREFRHWFTYLAEAQYFQSPAPRPAEINDCAALIRYAYREALRVHDSTWADALRLPVIPAYESVAKYQYPYTPLRAALFRARGGSFRASDLADGGFLQFADAQALWRYNTHPVGRVLARALPGDLLFFRQGSQHVTFHSMIYLGPSQLQKDDHRYVLYHTGPTGKDPGEIRRLTVDELLNFPQSEWRPVVSNPSFLGVARWNILRRGTNEF
jgi:uncharacterized protein